MIRTLGQASSPFVRHHQRHGRSLVQRDALVGRIRWNFNCNFNRNRNRDGASDSFSWFGSRAFSSTATSTATAKSPGKSGFVSWYSKQLDERPWTTKMVSSAIIAIAGDLIGQALESSPGRTAKAKGTTKDDDDDDDDDYHKTIKNATTTTNKKNKNHDTDDSFFAAVDWHRTGRFFLTGAFWVAPVTHLWYGFLSTKLLPGATVPKRILQRLVVDQLGFAPLFCTAYMGLLWLLEGSKDPSRVASDLVEVVPTLVTSNWKLWIPAQGLMFAVVPLPFQVVYSNLVGLVWTVYMSYASTNLATADNENENEKEQEKEKEKEQEQEQEKEKEQENDDKNNKNNNNVQSRSE